MESSSLARPTFYPTWIANQGKPSPAFDLCGGVLAQSPLEPDAAFRSIGWSQDPNTLAMEWQTSAPRFELLCAATGGSWRVLVRDVTVSNWTVLGQWSSTGWNAPRVQSFSENTGARRIRRFRVECANQLAWGIRLERSESIVANPPFPAPRRVVWCGDSFVEGTASPSTWQGFAASASALLGLDAHFDASGGTGFLSDGPPGQGRARYVQRLNNIVASRPSIVVVSSSTNDIGFPPAQVAGAASAHWKAIRRALPRSQIIVLGPIRMGSEWPTLALNDALKRAAAQNGLPFVDASNWITGTGKIGQPHRDGNADALRSSDGTHPTKAGHDFLAQKVAEALRPLLGIK